MKEQIDYLIREVGWLKSKVEALESERGPVRSDGFVMPTTPACETPQDRPRYADRSAVLKKLSAHFDDRAKGAAMILSNNPKMVQDRSVLVTLFSAYTEFVDMIDELLRAEAREE